MSAVITFVGVCCVLVCLYGNDAIFIETPVDAIVLHGSSASFNCSTNSTSSFTDGNYIQWYNSSDRRCPEEKDNGNLSCIVYYMDLPYRILSLRYQVTSINSTYGVHSRNLKIISTSLMDAGQYACYDWNSGTFASANLAVVAGQPRCSTNSTLPTLPNDTVSMLCQVDVNGSTNLDVSLTQGGKTLVTGNSSTVTWSGLALSVITDNVMCVAPAGISSSQCPTIQVKPGNLNVDNVKSEYVENDVLNCSAVGSSPLVYHWTTNTTVSIAPGSDLVVNKNMAGPVLFQCTVNNDYDNAQTSIAAVVAVPVTDITLTSQDTVHYVGEVITCDAAGYPPPTYTWNVSVNNSSIQVSGPVFNITSSMIGMNFALICTATNVVNGSTRSIQSTHVSFIVVGGLRPPSSTTVASSSVNTPPSKTTAIIAGVVCGVGGAAIIILVVLLVLFCRRRKSNGRSSDSSPPAKKAKAKVDTSATPNAAAQPLYAEVDKTRGANIATSSATTPPIYAHVGEGHEHIELSPMDTTRVNGSTGQYAEVGLEDRAAQNGVNLTINDSNEAYGYAEVTAGHLTRTRPTEPVAVVAENHYAAIDHTLKNVL